MKFSAYEISGAKISALPRARGFDHIWSRPRFLILPRLSLLSLPVNGNGKFIHKHPAETALFGC